MSQTFCILSQSISFFLSRIFSILTQSFSFIELGLLFFQLDLPAFESVVLVFLIWTFSVLTQSFPFTESVIPIFSTASFPLQSALHSDLITMCTVHKINDGGMCRRCLLQYLEQKIESLARKSDQDNTKRQEEREKKKMKLFLKLSSVRSQLATYIKLAGYLDTCLCIQVTRAIPQLASQLYRFL